MDSKITNVLKKFFWGLEDLHWLLRCKYCLWLHGPYGLAKVVEEMPYRFLIKYLRKYGAKIGNNCRFERGINLHRPFGKMPFKNLTIGNNVYLGHNTLIDLSRSVTIEDNVIFASRCQIWTHASYYDFVDTNNLNYGEYYGPVLVKNASIIYSGVIITHGSTIGQRSKIGAGSIVIRDVPDNTFVAGSPAKTINRNPLIT